MSDGRQDGGNNDVSAHYRALAKEPAPERLDLRVIEAAQRELGSGGRWRDAWFRPVVFAATAGLCFAFVLQFYDLPVGDLPPGVAETAPAAAPGAFEDAGRAALRTFRELEEETSRTMSESPGRSRPAGATGPQSTTVANETLQPAAVPCTDEERRRPTTWWTCVQRLEQAGHREVAEVELQALLRSFPSFEVPE